MQESGVDLEFDILGDIIEEFQPKVGGFYEIQSRILEDVIRYLFDFLRFEKRRKTCVCMYVIFILTYLWYLFLERDVELLICCIQKGRKCVLALFA